MSLRGCLQGAMTKRELVEALEFMDDEAIVLFSCDYGDRGHTEQALPVGEAMDASALNLYSTAYSKSGVAVLGDDPDDVKDSDEDFPVIILQG